MWFLTKCPQAPLAPLAAFSRSGSRKFYHSFLFLFWTSFLMTYFLKSLGLAETWVKSFKVKSVWTQPNQSILSQLGWELFCQLLLIWQIVNQSNHHLFHKIQINHWISVQQISLHLPILGACLVYRGIIGFLSCLLSLPDRVHLGKIVPSYPAIRIPTSSLLPA